MKHFLAILAALAIGYLPVPSEAAGWSDLHQMIGHVTEGKYSLYSVFGIEQWDNGKITTHRRQQWTLECDYPVTGNAFDTSCKLIRLVIDKELTPGTGDIVNSHRHQTSNGTLRLTAADWRAGKLRFTIVNSDGSTTDALLRFKIDDPLILLDSFGARAATTGSVFPVAKTLIEYRMPKYTYTLHVPVVMRGSRPASRKAWDEAFAALSAEDQNAWKELAGKKTDACRDAALMSSDDLVAEMTKDEARRRELKKGAAPEAAEKSAMVKYVHARWENCLAESTISAAGRMTILGALTKGFREMKTGNDEPRH